MGDNRRDVDACRSVPAWCFRKAEYLLENYASLKEQERKLKEELSKMHYYTHDDVLYLLSGCGSCRTDTDRVQTSNISNPCEKAVLNADIMQERLNRDIGKKEKRELRWVSDNLHIVETAFKLLAGRTPEIYHAAEQMYIKGLPGKSIRSESGGTYSRYQLKKMKTAVMETVAEQVARQEQFMEATRAAFYGAAETLKDE